MKNRLCTVITFAAVLVSLMFTGFRIGFVFVDHEVFNGFCYLLWSLFTVNSVFLTVKLRFTLTGRHSYPKPLYIVNIILTALSVACAAAFIAIGGSSEGVNYLYTSSVTLPYLSVFYALLFFILIFPHCKKGFRTAVAVCVCAALILGSGVFLFPLGGFAFRSQPTVFDDGDSYKVVFSTNRKSLGAVTYTLNGKETISWDRMTGRKESSLIHSIDVPYEALDNSSYTVSAVRVYEDIAYGGHTGKTITHEVPLFTPCPDDDFELLCITDNHACIIDWSVLRGDFDMALFLGDFASAVYSYDSIIRNFLTPMGEVTEGAKPAIYARGNHGNRGNFVDEMLSALDYDSLYYRVNIGEYVFTVLDSGEDKPDDNYEYGGFSDYEEYYQEELSWLKALPRQDGYNIVLAHCPALVRHFEDINTEFYSALNNQNVKFIIGGDFHRTELVPAEGTAPAYYICGSKTGLHGLNYTLMRMNKGKISITSKNLEGEIQCEAEFKF